MSSTHIRIEGTIDKETARSLSSGDAVLYTGVIYTARDAAHKRICEMLDRGEEPPLPLAGSIIYYAGPAPARPGQPTGPIGPTSSYRMDPYAPRLLDLGLRAMIGKGARSQRVIDACVRNQAVYFGATGGAAALIAKCVQEASIVGFEDLGAEAIRRLVVKDMPLTVVVDAEGHNLYETGPAAYLASLGQQGNLAN